MRRLHRKELAVRGGPGDDAQLAQGPLSVQGPDVIAKGGGAVIIMPGRIEGILPNGTEMAMVIGPPQEGDDWPPEVDPNP